MATKESKNQNQKAPDPPKAVEDMMSAPEIKENPLDRIGTGNPLARQIKSQLLGLENQRARSAEMSSINEQSVDELREVVTDKFQQFLEKNGVDVANPESIKAFIEAVRQTNPDMVVLLETIFKTLQKEQPGVNVGVLSEKRDLKRMFRDARGRMAESGIEEETEELPEVENEDMLPQEDVLQAEDVMQ